MVLDNLHAALTDSWMKDMGYYHPVIREDNVVGNTRDDNRASSTLLRAILSTSTFLSFNNEAAYANVLL